MVNGKQIVGLGLAASLLIILVLMVVNPFEKDKADIPYAEGQTCVRPTNGCIQYMWDKEYFLNTVYCDDKFIRTCVAFNQSIYLEVEDYDDLFQNMRESSVKDICKETCLQWEAWE